MKINIKIYRYYFSYYMNYYTGCIFSTIIGSLIVYQYFYILPNIELLSEDIQESIEEILSIRENNNDITKKLEETIETVETIIKMDVRELKKMQQQIKYQGDAIRNLRPQIGYSTIEHNSVRNQRDDEWY